MTLTNDLILAAVEADVPALLWGEPGVGKTASLTQNLEAAGYAVRVVVGNVRMPEDFGGLPRVTEHGVVLEPPRWAVELADADKGVLVLDELTTSTPAVQAAMLRLVCERYAGDFRLPDSVRIIAIANPTDTAAGGWNLAAPLANRFCHIDIGVDTDLWLEGIIAGFDTLGCTARHPRAGAPLGKATIAGYVAARRHVLAPGTPSVPSEAGKAWPSPRSWDMLSKILPYCHSLEMQHLASVGCIGAPAAAEFMTWVQHADLPPVVSVLSDPSSIDWKNLRPDQVYAILAGIVAHIREHRDLWGKAWEALSIVAKATSVDVGAHAAGLLLKLDDSLPVPPAAMMVYADLISAARI